jgi:hypothetical protein
VWEQWYRTHGGIAATDPLHGKGAVLTLQCPYANKHVTQASGSNVWDAMLECIRSGAYPVIVVQWTRPETVPVLRAWIKRAIEHPPRYNTHVNLYVVGPSMEWLQGTGVRLKSVRVWRDDVEGVRSIQDVMRSEEHIAPDVVLDVMHGPEYGFQSADGSTMGFMVDAYLRRHAERDDAPAHVVMARDVDTVRDDRHQTARGAPHHSRNKKEADPFTFTAPAYSKTAKWEM